MEHNDISIEWKVDMPFSHFGPQNQQPRKYYLLGELFDPKYQRGIGSLLYNRDRYPRVSLEPERFSGKTLSTSTSIRKDD